ncbi:MAG: LamG domain-containing protein [Planctomycetota bacterium]|nr:LamG domain-containing protein [Planctomycetota bacterium]
MTTIGPVQRARGPRGKALQVTEELQCVEVKTAPALELHGPLTLEGWVRLDDPKCRTLGNPALFGKGYEKGSYSLHARGVSMPNSGTLWFELDAADGKRHIYNPTDVVLSQNEWDHVAATYDGTTMRVYINGRQVGNGMQKTVDIATCAEPFRIGWLPCCAQFTGGMEDVRLYSRALSHGEIFARFKAGWAGRKH